MQVSTTEDEQTTAAASAPASTRAERYGLIAIAALALGVTAWFVAQRAWSLYDDAYIYFRYADNLLAGHGFRWNVADAPVEGFTGPLYLVVLTAAGALGAELEAFAQLFGVLAVGGAIGLGAITAFALGRAARSGPGDRAADGAPSDSTAPGPCRGAALPASLPWLAALLVAISLGTDHYFLVNAVIGLETGLAALIGVALLASATVWDGRALRTLLVLAVLTRPEFAVFSFAALVMPRARTVRWFAPLVIAAAAIALARWVIFDDLVPNTAHAKAGGTAAHARLGVEYALGVVRHFPAVVLAPLALIDRRTRHATVWYLLASAVWLGSFLRTGGDFFPFSRLAVPLVGGLTVLGAHGLICAAARFARGARATIVAASLVAALAGVGVGAQFVAHRLAPMNGFPDVRYWTAVGRWLGENHPDATVATTTIGAVGYFSGLHVYDIVGLTQPEVARDGELIPAELTRRNYIGHEKHNTAWVIAQRPDIILFEREAAEPWTDLQATRATYYAEWALLQEIKSGRLPYRLYSPEVAAGRFALMFVSPDYVARVRGGRGGGS